MALKWVRLFVSFDRKTFFALLQIVIILASLWWFEQLSLAVTWTQLAFFKEEGIKLEKTIEGSNIEYGNIEKCNVDTNLTSKIWRLVTSKKNDSNIEFIIDLINIDSKNGVKRGHSIPYHHQQSPPNPHPMGDPV